MGDVLDSNKGSMGFRSLLRRKLVDSSHSVRTGSHQALAKELSVRQLITIGIACHL